MTTAAPSGARLVDVAAMGLDERVARFGRPLMRPGPGLDPEVLHREVLEEPPSGSHAGRSSALRCCKGCGLVFFPPRQLCPGCWSSELSWQSMGGGGTVWTFTEVHVAFYDDTWTADGPYVVAVVELDEGPRLLVNIVEPDMATLTIGDRVETVFEDRPDGVTLPMFRVVS